MLKQDGFDELVVARLKEFWSAQVPWERSLWTLGSVALIEELLEAAAAPGMPERAFENLRDEVERFVGRDPATGDGPSKAVLRSAIRGDLRANSMGAIRLAQLLPLVRD